MSHMKDRQRCHSAWYRAELVLVTNTSRRFSPQATTSGGEVHTPPSRSHPVREGPKM
jgi:hypothetical protein